MLKIILLSLMFLIACCTSKYKYVSPEQFEHTKIVFGDGGGFSGYVNRFYLLDNGYLYKKMHRDTGYIMIADLEQDVARQLLGQWGSMGFDKIKLNKPGNAYHFMEFYEEGKRHRIVWDPYDRSNASELNKYYKLLRSVVQKYIENNENIR